MFLLICFLSATFICLIYDSLFFYRAFSDKETRYAALNDGLSIVVCAKDEADNLKENIPHWCNQRISELEVIVVNDHSKDQTMEVLKKADLDFPQLKVLEMDSPENPGKRQALKHGILNAKYDKLLLTDADCRPSSSFWAGRMTAPLDNPETDLVLGIGNYAKQAGVLNGFIRFETLLTASQFFGASSRGLTYMGVGRNLAIRRDSAIKAIENYLDWPSLSGDDDQLVQQIARTRNVSRVSHPDAITWSLPKADFKSWMRQKARHFGASRHYDAKSKLIAGLYPLARSVFGLSFLMIMILNPSWWIFLLWLILKGIHWSILRTNSLHIQSQLAVHEIVCFDFAWGVYYLVSPVWLAIFKSDKWE